MTDIQDDKVDEATLKASKTVTHEAPTNMWDAAQTIALLLAIVAIVYIFKVY